VEFSRGMDREVYREYFLPIGQARFTDIDGL
jgi:hypothetical protein